MTLFNYNIHPLEHYTVVHKNFFVKSIWKISFLNLFKHENLLLVLLIICLWFSVSLWQIYWFCSFQSFLFISTYFNLFLLIFTYHNHLNLFFYLFLLIFTHFYLFQLILLLISIYFYSFLLILTYFSTHYFYSFLLILLLISTYSSTNFNLFRSVLLLILF